MVMPEKLQLTFQNPEPNYYDGRFATQFQNFITDKYEGVDKINEVPSDYTAKKFRSTMLIHINFSRTWEVSLLWKFLFKYLYLQYFKKTEECQN